MEAYDTVCLKPLLETVGAALAVLAEVHDLLHLLRTPLGRRQVLSDLYGFRAWAVLSRLASAYRRSVVRRTKVIAVVGSFGKTTTARALTAALGRPVHPQIGLNEFGYVATALLRIRPGDRHAVIEVGIGAAGQMAQYARLVRPDVVVVTSIGSEHNRSLGTLKVTRSEKAEMVRALLPSGLAVLNGDDPHVRWMAGQTRARVLTFGLEANNDVRATSVALDWPHGTRFTLQAGGEERVVRSRLLGRHYVHPILAAVAVGLAEAYTLDELLPRLEALGPTPGRLQPVPLANGAFLLRDDFKSALETVETALDVLAEIPAERRLVVLGDVTEPPGSPGPMYRQLGMRVGQIASRAIFLGDNFRRYAVGAKRGGLPREALVDAGNNVLRAAEVLSEDLRPGDVVLIKGRSTQRLDRIALALAGRQVRCDIKFCNAYPTRCDHCPMLERGWDGARVVI